MSETITDPEAAAEATRIANRLAHAGRVALSRIGFEVTGPADVKIDIGTDEDPDHACITMTWPLSPEGAGDGH